MAWLKRAQDIDPIEEHLRAFDLTSKYGPVVGLTRRERWNRAKALGLDPPLDVLEIITAQGGESSAANDNLWKGRPY